MASHRFQVDLGGIITLLGAHLYSRPQVFLRELLQNGVDAIHARRMADASAPAPSILVEITTMAGGPPTLLVEDNGIGLTEDEIHRFLATIGASSKRRDGGPDQGFIGRFGIGLLSCFIVADEIVLLTRSSNGGTFEWRGLSDGTYSVRPASGRSTPGSSVYLRCKTGCEDHFTTASVERWLRIYGGLLPMEVTMQADGRERRIGSGRPPWRDSRAEDPRALIAWADGRLDEGFGDAFPLRGADGSFDGAAFILEREVSRQREQRHLVHVKGMFLSDQVENLAPAWAYFIKVVVDARDVEPTASRESLREDAALDTLRQSIATQLRERLVRMAESGHARFQAVVGIHHEGLRALAAEDDEACRVFAPWLPFETTRGRMRLGEFRERFGRLNYVASVDDYRQLAPLAAAQGLELLNAGYIHGVDIIERLAASDEAYQAREVTADSLCAVFDEVPLDDGEQAEALRRIAAEALAGCRCRIEVRGFAPESLPALYHASDEVRSWRRHERDAEGAPTLFAGIIGSLRQSQSQSPRQPSLILNWRNGAIRDLSRSVPAAKRALPLIYLQSLLLGHHPLGSEELDLLNRSLQGLINHLRTG